MRARLAIARLVIVTAVTLALVVFGATVEADQRRAPPFVVIVHPRSPEVAADRKFLEDAFLKKVTSWPNGTEIRPADLVPESRVRRRFSEDVLNRSVEAVKAYWQQRIFSGGDVPPPEFESDEQVVQYVLRHDGAVGYVSGDADLASAKVLVVR